ncbi:hypothetical protein [Paenibacillus xylanexedens]|nr:hypothetical protein [Paenibacillus xylanexedens]
MVEIKVIGEGEEIRVVGGFEGMEWVDFWIGWMDNDNEMGMEKRL